MMPLFVVQFLKTEIWKYKHYISLDSLAQIIQATNTQPIIHLDD